MIEFEDAKDLAWMLAEKTNRLTWEIALRDRTQAQETLKDLKTLMNVLNAYLAKESEKNGSEQ